MDDEPINVCVLLSSIVLLVYGGASESEWRLVSEVVLTRCVFKSVGCMHAARSTTPWPAWIWRCGTDRSTTSPPPRPRPLIVSDRSRGTVAYTTYVLLLQGNVCCLCHLLRYMHVKLSPYVRCCASSQSSWVENAKKKKSCIVHVSLPSILSFWECLPAEQFSWNGALLILGLV
jgi:hypothetical protein